MGESLLCAGEGRGTSSVTGFAGDTFPNGGRLLEDGGKIEISATSAAALTGKLL